MVYTPIEDEMVDFVAREIISKKLKDGDKLYSLRFFTNRFKAGPAYVKRAMAMLEDRGLIRLVDGEYYLSLDDRKIDALKENLANRIINDFLNQMGQIGLDTGEALTYLERRSRANG
ncbi:GntR family transcriptional regulator [Anaerococcus sp. AGMB09787]|uniref:GntR family transcriptional regulator n=1 Tax=Anaerococcus sp. AGMB09787 TaxID=2922869 RepID=UPI001FAFA41C|nr:GntR family transcriptional regulator [Anaerococcus sp. AGMB09787]